VQGASGLVLDVSLKATTRNLRESSSDLLVGNFAVDDADIAIASKRLFVRKVKVVLRDVGVFATVDDSLD